jgi:16S rRNA (adenine1518-N6/adenine1519-N6)-dimethyltransferase
VIRARKQFGQHFLEPAWVDKVFKAIAPKADEVFIEIGPGTGALTRPLTTRAGAVIAFEIDRDLAGELERNAPPNLKVVTGDFLRLSTNDLILTTNDSVLTTSDSVLTTDDSRLRVAGNLPYNIASPIMFRLVELHAAGIALVDATLMLQREVADRLTAAPGSKQYGVLSILIQHRAHVETLLKLPAGAFRPPPKVLSSLVRLRFREPSPAVRDEVFFTRLV